jgi:omega-amidase
MKNRVEIALVQMATERFLPARNLEKMVRNIREIAEKAPVDLIVFPELANTGYIAGRDAGFNERFIEAADTIPGPFTDELCLAARNFGVHIITGLAELHPTIPATLYNSVVLINSQGEIGGVHHKCHIPSEEKHYFYPGNTTEVYRTEIGTIGMMVCYDSEFPEMPRLFSLKGAEILVAVYNWGWKKGFYGPGRLSRLAAVRALENQVFFLACGKVGDEGEKSFYGNSTVAGPMGEIMFESKPEHDEQESVFRLSLERRDLVRTRAFNTTFRNRRPDLYGPLSNPF